MGRNPVTAPVPTPVDPRLTFERGDEPRVGRYTSPKRSVYVDAWDFTNGHTETQVHVHPRDDISVRALDGGLGRFVTVTASTRVDDHEETANVYLSLDHARRLAGQLADVLEQLPAVSSPAAPVSESGR